MLDQLPQVRILTDEPTFIVANAVTFPSHEEVMVNKSPVVRVGDTVFGPVRDSIRGKCAVLDERYEMESSDWMWNTSQFFSYNLFCECPGGGDHYCKVSDDDFPVMFKIPTPREGSE